MHHKFNPIIASDGDALLLLRKEFPELKSVKLPSYYIYYPENEKLLKWKLLLNSPKTLQSIRKEKRDIKKIILKENISGIISDNRYGVYSKDVPSVFITHQLNVLSGNTTLISSKIQQKFIKKFDQCWVPDINSEKNYSGNLSKVKDTKNIKYIGVLSRFQKRKHEIKYDLLVLLSGVENARKRLELRLIKQLKDFEGKVLFVKGKIEIKQEKKTIGNSTFVNFLLTEELEKSIQESSIIIARSGYSTIMDLAALEKKVFFIPTTGQYEQEHLAAHLDKMKLAPFSKEKEFEIKMLKKMNAYLGLKSNNQELNPDLFDLFHGK